MLLLLDVYMSNICCRYAFQHGLKFNAKKLSSFVFANLNLVYCTILEYSDEVKNLSHILSYNLDDNADIVRAVKDMNRMANSTICSISSVDQEFSYPNILPVPVWVCFMEPLLYQH